MARAKKTETLPKESSSTEWLISEATDIFITSRPKVTNELVLLDLLENPEKYGAEILEERNRSRVFKFGSKFYLVEIEITYDSWQDEHRIEVDARSLREVVRKEHIHTTYTFESK